MTFYTFSFKNVSNLLKVSIEEEVLDSNLEEVKAQHYHTQEFRG